MRPSTSGGSKVRRGLGAGIAMKVSVSIEIASWRSSAARARGSHSLLLLEL